MSGFFDAGRGRLCARAAAVGILLGAVLAAGHSAQAEPKDGEKFKDWTVGCTDESAAESCFIYQSVVSNETQQRVMMLGVSDPPGEEGPRAVVAVPLGVDLRPGIQLRIDEGEPLRGAFVLCLPDGCRAHIRMDDALLAAFKKGNRGTVSFIKLPEGRTVTLPISLAGFTAAFNALQ